MLRSVTQAIECLKTKGLLFREKLYGAVAQGRTNARIKTDSLLGPSLANSPSAVENGSFQKHLKSVIKKNQCRGRAACVARPVKDFYG